MTASLPNTTIYADCDALAENDGRVVKLYLFARMPGGEQVCIGQVVMTSHVAMRTFQTVGTAFNAAIKTKRKTADVIDLKARKVMTEALARDPAFNG
jgi:hypothetical protein